MPGAAIGALLGMAFGTTMAAGVTFLGYTAGTMWMLGASIGSLFDQVDVGDLSGSTPTYSFGELSNTMTQLLPVPIVYGEIRAAGNMFMRRFYDDTQSKMDLLVGIGEGPISKIHSVYCDDVRLTDDSGTWVATDKAECSLNIHLGGPDQEADSRHPEVPYNNTAYIGLTLRAQDGISGTPTISSIVQGRIVWTPAGERYTTNPAWLVYDVLTNKRYALGIDPDLIDLESFEASAAFCDELVDGAPRYTLNFSLDTQKPAIDHLRDMLSCFRGYIVARDKIRLCVDRSVSAPSKTITADNIVRGSFSWWQKPDADTLNRITIEWVDPENYYERTTTAFEWWDDIVRRGIHEKKYSLLGITNAAQVGRMGYALLEASKKVIDFCSFSVSLKDCDIEAGDVIAVTYDLPGWTRKWMRVVAVRDDGNTDCAQLTCSEYVASCYDDSALDVPRPDPDNPPVNRDDVFALTLSDVGYLEGDGSWIPIVRAEWQNPSSFTPSALRVRYRYDDDPEGEWKLHLDTSSLVTQTDIKGLESGKTVTVWVKAVKSGGSETDGVQAAMLVGKDTTPPGAPTSLTATGWFGSIWLTWVNPTDADLKHVEVWECDHDTLADAVKIAEVPGTSYNRYLGSFAGRYYWVRAVDFSGNVSQWNAEAGTYGYSDIENAKDFWDRLLQITEVAAAVDWLKQTIPSLAESHIKTLLGDADESWKAALEQRKQEKIAEMQIQGALADFDDYKWSLAAITEEKTTRETENEAIASWVRSVAAMIGNPDNPADGTVFAALREELTARAAADEASAKRIETLEAAIGDPWNPGAGTIYAALRDDREASVTRDEALARDIQIVSAGIGDPVSPVAGTVFAVIADEKTARAAADSALASQQTTLQTQLAGNTASIQELLQSVDGIRGQWGILLDINGRITGLTLIGGQSHTSMVFKVDSFIVQTPDGDVPPFMIGTVDGQLRTVIRDTWIQDAAIKSAKIKDAAVETLKIAGNAVSVMAAQSPTSTIEWTTDEYKTVAYVQPSLLVGFPVLIQFSCNVHVGECTAMVRLLRNGSVVSGQSDITIAQYGDSARFGAVYSYQDQAPSTGTVRYEIQMKKSGGLYLALYTRSMWALHTKR